MNIGNPFSAVCRLFIPSFCLITLLCTSGCGGEDAPQSHTDTTAHANPVPSPAPGIAEETAADSIPAAVPGTVQSSTDSLAAAAKKKANSPKADSAKTVKTSGKERTDGTAKTEQIAQAAGKGDVKAGEKTEVNTGSCAEATPELQRQGRMVFVGKGNCVSCHGSDGKGQVLGPDLTDAKWLHINGSYSAIAGIVRSGVNLVIEYPSPMPPMGGSRLTDEEICAVAAYIWSLSH